MTNPKNVLYPLILFAAVATAAVAQQNPAPPAGPFRAVHLMNMTAEQEAKYMAFVRDANQQFAKLGCAACAYHVYKVGAAGGGKYNHMQVSEWPGRDVYVKLHTDANFRAIDKKHPIRAEVEKTEFYDRFVEVK
jgi:hypothetical protein